MQCNAAKPRENSEVSTWFRRLHNRISPFNSILPEAMHVVMYYIGTQCGPLTFHLSCSISMLCKIAQVNTILSIRILSRISMWFFITCATFSWICSHCSDINFRKHADSDCINPFQGWAVNIISSEFEGFLPSRERNMSTILRKSEYGTLKHLLNLMASGWAGLWMLWLHNTFMQKIECHASSLRYFSQSLFFLGRWLWRSDAACWCSFLFGSF